MKVLMTYRKSTKNTHVFDEIEEDGSTRDSTFALIPTLYIRKLAFKNSSVPVRITVTVEVD